MIKHIQNAKAQAVNNFNHIMFFAGLFLAIGWGIPEFYYKYLDKTDYYRIENLQFDNDSKFKECSPITYTIKRYSLVDSEILRDREINLILEDGTRKEVWRDHVIDQIDKGEAKIRGEINPPCGELKTGKYFLNIVISYKVRSNEKVYNFKSDQFEVIK